MQGDHDDDRASVFPPYKCARTPDPQTCLKFKWNPVDMAYNLPPGGERVSCSECQHFFE